MAVPVQQQHVPTRDRRRARLALNRTLICLADYLTQIVPTKADVHTEPTEWITVARRVRLWQLEVSLRAVTLARESGATWREIADAFALNENDVRVGERRTWSQPWRLARLSTAIDGSGDPDLDARAQDAWLARRGASATDRPVSGALY
jgi:hypothetical protein